LCQQYISKKVSGVFFAPLEFEAEAEKMNRRILSALKHAEIAVVLLDRRSAKAPERNRPDLVGINNHQAGYVATEHLIQLGCKQIGFLGYEGAASTIADRVAGYHDALAAHGLRPAIDPAMQVHLEKQQSISWSGRAGSIPWRPLSVSMTGSLGSLCMFSWRAMCVFRKMFVWLESTMCRMRVCCRCL
jgi:DNA-binding LacI/PurR family transcriptional regulator